MPTSSAAHRAREAVSERVQNLLGAEGQAVEIFVESGADYAELVSRAEAFRADLVVVASHGHTGMKRALLGGVAATDPPLRETNVQPGIPLRRCQYRRIKIGRLNSEKLSLAQLNSEGG